MNKINNEVVVLTGSNKNNIDLENDLKTNWSIIRMSPIETKLWPIFLKNYLLRLSPRFDRIISCNYQAALVLGRLKKYPFDNKHLTQVFHGRDFRYFIERPFLREKVLIRNTDLFLKRLFRINKLIAVSESLRSDMLNYGYPANKVEVIHHGIKFKPELLKRKDNKMKKILVVGRVEPEKNIIDCIKFIQYYNNRNKKKLNLSIVGNGSQLNELQQYVFNNKILEIKFLGAKLQNELHELYKNHDALFSFSEKETFGLVFLEALRSGCLIFARENSSIGEIIDDKKDGFILKTKEHYELETLINELDSSSIKRVIDNGYRKLQAKFDITLMAKKYIDEKDII